MRAEWGLLLVIPFVMLVHGIPHVPGDAVDGPLEAYPALAERTVDALRGEQYPYPVHADEGFHVAQRAQIVRQQTADIDDPYVGGKETEDLFTVQGMRSERGWNVAIVQLSLLTDLSLLAAARFIPAIWAGFLALTVWAALRPAPGAIAAAAMVAILPTSVRFLGVGFLVPSAFALPWVFVTLIVASRVNGAQRFFGLLLLITAAHFMHLVLGMIAILAGVAGTMVRDEPLGRRGAMLAAVLLPLLWILPGTYVDARSAVLSEHALPFEEETFLMAGLALYILAAIGAMFAFMQPGKDNLAHRALALMAIPVTISLFVSVLNDHRNDATYSRIIFVFFLAFSCLAAYGVAAGIQWLQARLPQGALRQPWLRYGATVLAIMAFLPTPLAANIDQPHHQYYDDEAWESAQRLEAIGLTTSDIILALPEHGPMYAAVSGALLAVPFTPSEGAANEDWEYYVASSGADKEWLDSRGITFVVGLPPNAPHRNIGSNVFQLT